MEDIPTGLADERMVKVVFLDRRRALGRVGKMGVDVGFPNESKSSVVDMGKGRKTYVLGADCAFSGLE